MSEITATFRLELRMTPQMLAAIDSWRRTHPNPPARATAVRMLVEQALDASKRIERKPK